MIHKMREMAPTIMLIILIAFVGGTIFLDWGMNLSGRRSSMTAAGKINGKEIPLTYFDHQVNVERQRLQEGGREVSPFQYRMIPGQIWEREVNRILMQDVISRMKLGASADEVFEYMKKNPLPGIDTVSAFQTDGVFDTSKYVQFLNSPENYDYYPWLREIESYAEQVVVPAQKLENIMNAGVIPSKAEIEYQYRQDHQKVKYEYLKVNSNAFKVDSSSINDVMVRKYYEAHKDSFVTKEQADLYYVKFEKKATENDYRFYEQELTDLKDKIMSSGQPLAESFAEEARVESDDPGSVTNGGDLGWFRKGTMVPEFDSVAFSADVGTIAGPVKTQFGYHLILVEAREKKDGELQVKARHILRKIVPTMETLDLLAEQADSLRIDMVEKGFVEAVKARGDLKLDSTGFFKKGDPIPGIGFVSGVGQFTFGPERGAISERLENNDAIYLFSVKRRLKKGTLPLEDVRENIVETLTNNYKKAAAKEFADSLLKKIDGNDSLGTYSAPESGVLAGVTDTISLSGFVPGIGSNNKVTATAFALGEGKLSGVIEHGENYYIVKTLYKEGVDSIPWDSPEIEQIKDRLTQQSKQKVYYDWYIAYKNKSDIKSNVDDLYLD